jgi:hypothetical protein
MTREECIAKAEEMEMRAKEARDWKLRSSYLEIASGWRTLAAQAQVEQHFPSPPTSE